MKDTNFNDERAQESMHSDGYPFSALHKIPYSSRMMHKIRSLSLQNCLHSLIQPIIPSPPYYKRISTHTYVCIFVRFMIYMTFMNCGQQEWATK